jgi:hypothetical protein
VCSKSLRILRAQSGKQFFNVIDPSPFRDKDVDPKAEEFIVGWAKDLPRDASLALVVDLDREAGLPDEAAVLREAIHEFFSQRAQAYRRRLRELLRVGRTSLLIGLVALASAIALDDFLAGLMKGSRIGDIVRESFTIGGWVSMWRHPSDRPSQSGRSFIMHWLGS